MDEHIVSDSVESLLHVQKEHGGEAAVVEDVDYEFCHSEELMAGSMSSGKTVMVIGEQFPVLRDLKKTG